MVELYVFINYDKVMFLFLDKVIKFIECVI